jgi:hypothetical protein
MGWCGRERRGVVDGERGGEGREGEEAMCILYAKALGWRLGLGYQT